MKKENLRAIVTLTVITLVAGILLGFIYELTKEPIAAQELLQKQEAYRQVFAQADSFEDYADFDEEAASKLLSDAGFAYDSISEASVAYDASGEVLGYVFTVISMEGYGGEIDVAMGITKEGVLNGIEILSIGETAGLGMKADTPEFKEQFKDKQVSQFSYTKSGASQEYEIDALSGATITTNAMTNAVNAGLIYFQNITGGGN
ncbi:MAG: RnfABCDGE type electron transport complex subunit G [Lachnospiraceae bacterium]|nr:RnfABCDGE type electron transport complex subunit G [Lachnospiraceae bacterium]